MEEDEENLVCLLNNGTEIYRILDDGSAIITTDRAPEVIETTDPRSPIRTYAPFNFRSPYTIDETTSTTSTTSTTTISGITINGVTVPDFEVPKYIIDPFTVTYEGYHDNRKKAKKKYDNFGEEIYAVWER